MALHLVALLLLVTAQEEKVETVFRQLRPKPSEEGAFEKSDDRSRAVVMIQGLKPHLISNDRVRSAVPSGWQKANSALGKALAPHADLYAFYYSQNVAVDKISEAKNDDGRTFGDFVGRLKKLGYKKIVLVAYSAGGLVARQFVEDHPDSGVTKVIQVSPPNGGTSWGKHPILVPKAQEPFLESLTKEARRKVNEARAKEKKKIPDAVEFVVVMGSVLDRGDLILRRSSQWSKELRDQRIPMVELNRIHYLTVRSKKGARKIAELVTTPQPRWSAEKVKKEVDKLID